MTTFHIIYITLLTTSCWTVHCFFNLSCCWLWLQSNCSHDVISDSAIPLVFYCLNIHPELPPFDTVDGRVDALSELMDPLPNGIACNVDGEMCSVSAHTLIVSAHGYLNRTVWVVSVGSVMCALWVSMATFTASLFPSNSPFVWPQQASQKQLTQHLAQVREQGQSKTTC